MAQENAIEKRKSENIKNVNIKTNNGTVFGDVFNNSNTSQDDKRRKVVHVNDKSNTWNINSQEEVWEAIGQHLKASITHNFRLEKYHTIQCGYLIKCNPSIPDDLYTYFKDDNYTIQTPFQTCSPYTPSVLVVMITNESEAIEEVVKSLKSTEVSSTSQDFIKEFFRICLFIYKKPNLYERLFQSETSFNHGFVWLLMEFAVNSMPDIPLKFLPAEYNQKCSTEDYKADACVLVDKVKLSILETSGKLLLSDSPKYGSDHIKVHYGAICIYNNIFKKYC